MWTGAAQTLQGAGCCARAKGLETPRAAPAVSSSLCAEQEGTGQGDTGHTDPWGALLCPSAGAGPVLALVTPAQGAHPPTLDPSGTPQAQERTRAALGGRGQLYFADRSTHPKAKPRSFIASTTRCRGRTQDEADEEEEEEGAWALPCPGGHHRGHGDGGDIPASSPARARSSKRGRCCRGRWRWCPGWSGQPGAQHHPSSHPAETERERCHPSIGSVASGKRLPQAQHRCASPFPSCLNPLGQAGWVLGVRARGRAHLPSLENLGDGVQPGDAVLVHAGDVADAVQPGPVADQQLRADSPPRQPSPVPPRRPQPRGTPPPGRAPCRSRTPPRRRN